LPAGSLYTATLPIGVFSLMYVPSRIIVSGNPGATIANIAASESLYRWWVFGEVIGAALLVAVIVAVYRLLADVDRLQAWLMVGLGVMPAPILLLNVLSELSVLGIVNDPGFAAAFTPAQLQKLAQLLLRSHGAGFTLLDLFSGLWLFPFAVLVWRSGFLPRALAVLQVVAGLSYVIAACAALLAPALYRTIDPVCGLVSFAGETPAMLWLLFIGARTRSSVGASPAASADPAVARPTGGPG
jgi:hypothetical protein